MPPSSDVFLALQSCLAGRYSLERELGRGGMGIVYLAHEVALDRRVALKLLPPELAAQEALKDRFLREARTAAKLSHPNIVPIYAVDEIEQFVFFAMAYIKGATLGQRLRSRGAIPPGEATRILREVTWALGYAHAQGVVHRDVKPDNILLEDDSGRAFVTDFGIAQVRDPSGGLTAQGEILGTAEFMSPEQAAGEPADQRSDLYSLGVVGYYMLSGQLPFDGPTVQSVLAKHITQPAPPLAGHAGIPGKLCQAVDRCLAKNPADRFQTGEALAEALEAAVEVHHETPVPIRVFQKRLRATSIGIGIAGVILLPQITAGIVWLATHGHADIAFGVTAGAVASFVALPILSVARRARTLLTQGYDNDDVALGIKVANDRQREELRYEYRMTTSREHILRGVSVVSAVGAGTLLVVNILHPGHEYGALAFMSALIAGLTGVRWLTRRNVRLGNPGFWQRMWRGRIGRWLFKLAGIRLTQPAVAGGSRPTELVIGTAADQLFNALPKTTRRQLGDLPLVVRNLEQDAQKMRRRIEELNGSLAAVRAHEDHKALQTGAEGQSGEAANRRDALTNDLKKAIQGAESRLQQAVASLETIRLELLRMQAGAGSVESLTADLTAAKEVSEEIARLLEGKREVEAALANPKRPTTPV